MDLKKPFFWEKKNFISFLLLPFSLITFTLNLRKIFLKKKKFTIKTICVGNIYIGGTGKTSLSIKLYKILKKNFHIVFVKKKYVDQLDEKYLLDSHGEVINDFERTDSLLKAQNKNFDLAILDDGLQEKKITYDLSIVCFNPSYGFGNGFLLPAGPLRENISELANYDAIFINGEKRNKNVITTIRVFNKNIFYTNYFPLNLNKFNRKKKYLFFCGIGNPHEFENTLKKFHFKIDEKLIFPDHHNYRNSEINEIKKLAKEKNLEIITTEKDFKRLSNKNKKIIKFLKIELRIENLNKFLKFLKKKI
ncbi:MAG: tetraacyldisaccharide 4'-kinase [Candidatus Pelagibacter sp.]